MDAGEPRYGKDLHQAVNRNDEEGLLRVLKAGTVDVNVCEKLGLTPLMVAAQKGFTSLMLACFAGHLDIVMQLRQLGATWQSQDIAGCSPLHWAVDGGHLPVVTYMIQNGCEVSII
ncbi:fibronectin type 3 and ankyrin repeat domains protein 1 [Silurus meridionalis]|nr:fibronectin type 3 and ankyrin repeat domains protein 1 [Silurus meridionalis]